ncbi:hypothetical protein [Nocardia sp. NPDC057353]|uniref:hypothetical protein n=1 Tax=Nocardia sp. NPDC057353 TaxID=3346104 RepID=UPI00362F26C6
MTRPSGWRIAAAAVAMLLPGAFFAFVTWLFPIVTLGCTYQVCDESYLPYAQGVSWGGIAIALVAGAVLLVSAVRGGRPLWPVAVGTVGVIFAAFCAGVSITSLVTST